MAGPDDPDKGAPPRSEAGSAGDGEDAGRPSSARGGTSAGPGRRKRKRRPKKRKPARSSRTPRGPSTRFVRLRESRRQLLFAGAGLLAVLATSVILLVFGYGRFRGPGTSMVEIDWPGGLDAEAAAELLADNGLVRSASATALYFRASGGTDDFVAGPHVLPRNASPHDLRVLLARSASRPSVRVVIPEGFHRFDIAERLHKQGVTGRGAFLAATSDRGFLVELGIDTTATAQASLAANQERTTAPPESAEGYLFPATYDFQADTEAREIVRRLVAEADQRWSALVAQHAGGLASVASSLGWGRREVVTLASIIQREAVMDDERPIIASVFYNRLLDPTFKPRRRLQSDPTAMYGCVAHPEEAPTCADYKGKPTSAILHDAKNRYSTYMAAGLPPGPISNPGVASLQAALAPASTKFLFFVAKGGGRHTFSETFGAHNGAIQRNRGN